MILANASLLIPPAPVFLLMLERRIVGGLSLDPPRKYSWVGRGEF